MAKSLAKNDILGELITATKDVASKYAEGKLEKAQEAMGPLMDLAYTWKQTHEDEVESVTLMEGVGRLFTDETPLGKTMLSLKAALEGEQTDDSDVVVKGHLYKLSEMYEAAKGESDGDDDEDTPPEGGDNPDGDEGGEEPPEGGDDPGDEGGDGGDDPGDTNPETPALPDQSVETAKGWGHDIAADYAREQRTAQAKSDAVAQRERLDKAANAPTPPPFRWGDVKDGEHTPQS